MSLTTVDILNNMLMSFSCFPENVLNVQNGHIVHFVCTKRHSVRECTDKLVAISVASDIPLVARRCRSLTNYVVTTFRRRRRLNLTHDSAFFKEFLSKMAFIKPDSTPPPSSTLLPPPPTSSTAPSSASSSASSPPPSASPPPPPASSLPPSASSPPPPSASSPPPSASSPPPSASSPPPSASSPPPSASSPPPPSVSSLPPSSSSPPPSASSPPPSASSPPPPSASSLPPSASSPPPPSASSLPPSASSPPPPSASSLPPSASSPPPPSASSLPPSASSPPPSASSLPPSASSPPPSASSPPPSASSPPPSASSPPPSASSPPPPSASSPPPPSASSLPPSASSPPPSASSPPPPSASSPPPPSASSLPPSASSLPPSASSPPPPASSSPASASSPPPPPLLSSSPSLRRQCRSCQQSLRTVSGMRDIVVQKTDIIRAQRHQLRDLKKKYAVRVVNQRHKRHIARCAQLSRDIKHLHTQVCQSERTVLKKARQLRKSSSFMKQLVSTSRENKKLRGELSSARKQIRQLELELSLQKVPNDEPTETIAVKKGKKAYSSDIRKCIYHMLQCDVPVQHCGYLADKVLSCLAHKTLEVVPSKPYAAQLAYEMGVLSSLQLAEFLLSQDKLCLAWDATSVDGDHINEIHVVSDVSNLLSLDVRQIAGGCASDYAAHIISVLQEIATTYARFTGQSSLALLKRIHRSISCTLTDRAAVNRCVVRQLCDELGSGLLELHCNLHPLDSFAREARCALTAIDREHSIDKPCYGQSAAVGVIQAVAKLRYKAGSGDPEGFKNFLRNEGLALTTFPRYVGNRLHVMFHLAGLVVQHLEKLKAFFRASSYVGATLKGAILKGLENENIVAQLWALGIVGKTITGPWMTVFYADHPNLDMIPTIEGSLQTLKRWVAKPDSLIIPKKDVFKTALKPEEDLTLFSLVTYQCSSKTVQSSSLQCILNGVLKVMTQQLQRYVHEGELAILPPEEREKASSAPCHNMGSERTLAILDRLARRAPNATSGFFSGKIRAKLNRTLDWLEVKDRKEQEDIVAFAMREGYQCRQRCLKQKEDIREEVGSRLRAKSKKRDSTKRNALARKIAKYLVGSLPHSALGLAADSDVERLLLSFKDDHHILSGSLISHTWDMDGEDRVFYGRVQEIRLKSSTKKRVLTISYWSAVEIEADGEDYDVAPEELFSDIAIGDAAVL